MGTDFETEELILKVVFGGILLIVGLALYRVFEWWLKIRRQIETFGVGLGLNVIQPPRFLGLIPRLPELTGTWNGWTVQIGGGDRGTRGWSCPYAILSMGRVDLSLWHLVVRPRGLDATVGLQEIRSGDAATDRQWTIESNRPAYAQAALSQEALRLLQEVGGAFLHGIFELREGEFSYTDEGALDDPECLARLRRAVTAGAHLLKAALVQVKMRDDGINVE
ncbi:MAG: hypothetical protein K9M98_07515 [Cephaloticoccus sp.]|nr:hypothetical protein [Cephaloticoccus sp.]MCF7760338.1 hypothetical protein [Cephaloticoccus sp.]